jgi:hypothetical membrane protein
VTFVPPLFAFSAVVVTTSWVYNWTLIIEAVLLLGVVYLLIRSVLVRFRSPEKMVEHIGKAIPILKWIAAFAALSGLLGALLEGYSEITALYISGQYHPDRILTSIAQPLVIFTSGIIVSCATMLAMAIIHCLKYRTQKPDL